MPNDAGDPKDATQPRRSGATLDLVLALYRSPGLRHVLHERPLPGDIGVIMRLASASQPLLDDTAARVGEEPATLLEAARFYLQQVLFESGDDAYRVLGVTRDAPQVRIRDHHRWLQRWLHPDHNDDGLESPFAARLNSAWVQLRNEHARAAYDAWHPSDTPREPTAHVPAPAPREHRWTTVPAPARPVPSRWLRRGALAATLGVCALGAYLAIARREPPPAPAQASVASDASGMPQPARKIVRPPSTRPAVPPSPRVADAHPDRAPAPQPAATATTAPALAAPVQQSPAASIASAALRAPARAPAPRALPVPPSLRPVAAADAAPAQAAPRARAASADASPRRAAAAPPRATALADGTRAGNLQPAASPVPAGAAPVATPPAPAPLSATALVQRIDLARTRVRELVGYFRSTDDGAPGWPDARAPFSARVQREALRARNGVAAAASFALDAPAWDLHGDGIAMRADYRVERGHGVVESGRFQVRMAWRDDAWQLTRIALEPGR